MCGCDFLFPLPEKTGRFAHVQSARASARFSERKKMARPNPTPAFLTIPQAAARLNLSRSSLYKIIDAGDLPLVKFGKSSRISVAALDAFIARAEGRAAV